MLVRLAVDMNIPILGLVENMSYIECPTCAEKISVFGESHAEETAKKFNIDTGSNTAQENFNKSKDAILGKVARTHIITKIIKNDFSSNKSAPIFIYTKKQQSHEHKNLYSYVFI